MLTGIGVGCSECFCGMSSVTCYVLIAADLLCRVSGSALPRHDGRAPRYEAASSRAVSLGQGDGARSNAAAVMLQCRPGSSARVLDHAHHPMLVAWRAGRLGRLAELAQTDSFITRVLGTDCYTAALAAVNGDCRSLGHEQKTRLALAFSNCHLHKLGKRTYACTERMSLPQCVDHEDTVRALHSWLGQGSCPPSCWCWPSLACQGCGSA